MMAAAKASPVGAPVAPVAVAPAPAADIKLNAFALVWAVIKDFVANLFRRTKAT
jgi:hypothetical protein